MDVITKAKDLKTFTRDVLIGNPQNHELNRHDGYKKKNKNDKSLALKSTPSYDDKDEDIAYLTRRFCKIVRKHGDFGKKGSSSQASIGVDLCHRYRKPRYFMRDCLMNKFENKGHAKLGNDRQRD